MKKIINNALVVLAATATLTCSVARAQNGLAGELDDLLGISDEVSTAADADESPAAEPEAAESEVAAPEADSETASDLAELEADAAEADVEEAVAEAEAAVEAEAEAVEAIAETETEEALADVLAPVVETAVEAEAEAEAAVEAEVAEAEAVEAVAETETEEALADVLAPVAEAEAAVDAEAVEAEVEAAEAAPVPAETTVTEVAADATPEAEAVVAEESEPEAVAGAEVVAETVPEEAVAETESEAAATPAVEASVEVAPVAEADIYAGSLDDETGEIALLEEMRRKALDEHGKACYELGIKALKDGNYQEAIKQFEESVKFLVNKESNRDLIDAADKALCEATYRLAEVHFKRGDLDNARRLANRAGELGHAKSAALLGKIQDRIDNPLEEKVVDGANRWIDRDYRKNREQIKARIARARQYYITGELDKARDELEIILRDNPYDRDAMYFLKRVADRTYDVESTEARTTRATMIQEVKEKWTPEIYAKNVPTLPSGDSGVDIKGAKVNVAGLTPEEETLMKMEKIIIPEINFKNASINDVIDYFVEASREFDDANIPPEQRGVNLILKVAPSSNDMLVDENDPFAAVPSSSSGIPPITFSARFMSLKDGLQYACELSQLKYRIRGNTVMIMPQNEADSDMVSRTYTVLPSIEERAVSMSSTLSERTTDSSGATMFGSSEDTTANSGGTNWKQLFEDMGVKWPNGSSIKYLPSINKMRVLNTPENLVEFEKALQELNVTPRQVEIEARFVEVAQTDLESLGVEWMLTDNWEIAQNKNNPAQHISVAAGAGTSSANRYLSDSTALPNGKTSIPFPGLNAVNDAVLTVNSVLTNPELGFVLHMLSQQANTDLLSSPKVVTMNGEEAIIKVVREYIYPTEYEIKENDSSDGDSDNVQVSYPSVEPQEFETREVGVILQVVPQVSEDGQMISLELNPQIIDEPEWKDYGFDYPIAGQSTPYHITMEQPIFKVRSVQTKISIYNGATVVMGGMITETRHEVNDKIPFLGDIPLVGRLFRSTYEQSEKRNLLIFVTARMVDPAGRTLKTNVADAPVAATVDE